MIDLDGHRFEFPDDFTPQWNPTKPELSQLANDAALLPYLEPFIVNVIRRATSHITDPTWMREWMALYDKGEQELTRLDTAKMQLSPAAMLPARRLLSNLPRKPVLGSRYR